MPDNRQKPHKTIVSKEKYGSQSTNYSKKSSSSKKPVAKKLNAKKKVNKKHKKVKKGSRVAIFLLATTLGVSFIIGNKNNMYFSLDFTNDDTKIEEKESADVAYKQRSFDREDFINYKKHCVEGSYGSERYLFLPDEYLYEMAEYAINSLDEAFIKVGKKVIANNSSLPEFLTEEFLMGVIVGETSKRVCSLDGTPIGLPEDMKVSEYGGAIGIMQQKEDFRNDGDRYMRKLLGDDSYSKLVEGIDLDGADPLISMYRAIANYTRYYDNYLYAGSPAERCIGKDNIITGAIACYNKGEGTFSSWMSDENIDKFWHYAENSSYVDNILKYMNKYEKWAKSMGYKNNVFATAIIDEEYTQ